MSDYHYPLLQGLLYDTPLMLTTSRAEQLHQVLQGIASGNPLPVNATEWLKEPGRQKSYRVTTGGIAVVPVLGTLTHRGGYLDALSGLTSYSRLSRRLREAAADSQVKGILLDVDSPGGSVSGLFDLARSIRDIDAEKPVWAISNESMFSAAYAIGSSARRIVAPETGMAGSIGVIMLHRDQSAQDEKKGLAYTPIFAGARKNDGSSHEPLSDTAMETYQGMVNHIYDLFVAHVAAGRPVDEQAVRDTEAQIYTANAAVDVGLIDGIASFDEAVAEFEAAVSRGTMISTTPASAGSHQETAMSNETPMADAITEADLEAARAEGKQEGLKEGAAAEQQRVADILNLESAQGKIDGTLKAALETGQRTEAADKFLAALPKQGTGFMAAMAGIENPDVAADAAHADEPADETALAARAVSLIQ